MSFWVSDYIQMLSYLNEAGFEPQPVVNFLRNPNIRAAILRHDVDRRPAMAIQMAEYEARAGIQSTYYFRCNHHGSFPVAACRRIADLGHETGYHYEDLTRGAGDRKRALTSFARNLANFRAITPCLTISMHGSPFSTHDNRTLLSSADIVSLGLIGDASQGVEEYAPLYFTDAGGAWNDERINFRDRQGQMEKGLNPLIRAELFATLQQCAGRPVSFNLHPERWATTRPQFYVAYGADKLAALLKRLFRSFR